MTVSEAREKLQSLQAMLHAYNHALGVLYYDGVTGAPRGGAPERGDTMALLSGEIYKLATGEDTRLLVHFLQENISELTQAEARQTELLARDLRELEAIPMEEYMAYQKLVNDASEVWHTAKETNDASLFLPYLEQLLSTQRRFALLVAPEKDPYDYCLDLYEEGLNMETCDAFFSTLRAAIVPLLEKVKAAEQVDNSFLKLPVPQAEQEKLTKKLMAVIGMDPRFSAVSTTEHPFTTNFSKHDVRITTHYYEEDFASSMYSVIHEGGHALYELHTGDELQGTNLAEGCSMALHESQSRFFENILGRSRPFVEYLLPTLRELCPALETKSAEDVYRAINRAEPSLIRTEADELTYCLHIMVRYELEKALFHDELKVSEIPQRWNELYKEYLGIDVPDDTHGFLQDSHWSGGSFGYFPSYALGSAYGAQLLGRLQQSVDTEECIREGDFAPVNAWLTENIWQYGRLYRPAELLEKALGAPFDPQYYIDYLTEKYTDIYHLG